MCVMHGWKSRAAGSLLERKWNPQVISVERRQRESYQSLKPPET